MPPHIYRDYGESHPQSFPILHPGFGKGFREQNHQPHVFQQSVTLTASMWDENDPQGSMEDWNLINWSFFSEYSPLFVGLACGFGIVLLIMSTVMLWRYCLLSTTKKVCCKGSKTTPRFGKNSLPLRKEKCDNQNGFEAFEKKLTSCEKYSVLQRSVTVGAIPSQKESITRLDVEEKVPNLNDRGFVKDSNFSNPSLDSPLYEPLILHNNIYTSHLYLEKLDKNPSGSCKNISKSTPDLEVLYAKVNFSKKKRNRMRKDEAAIIALSKSNSGNSDNSLACAGGAVVVYNERTAL